jgi:hypothetical protein
MTINTIFFSDSNPNSNFTHYDHEVGEVCIPNISPAERQKRLSFGIRQFITTLVILAVMIVLGLNHFWRLPLLFLFWAAGTGFFQAFDKT